MKYLKSLFIFFLTLSFSATLSKSVFAFNTKANSLSTLSVKSNELNDDYNNIFINMPKEKVVDVFSHNNDTIYLTQEDVNLMAQIVYAESKGEPYEGKIAVASVILNRVLDPKFPNTIRDVIFQSNAFSCVINGTISVEPTEECYNAVYDAIKGNDPTQEALFFYNPSIATCNWMKGIEKTDSKTIGQHLFFNTK